jgi:hypothetical protein
LITVLEQTYEDDGKQSLSQIGMETISTLDRGCMTHWRIFDIEGFRRILLEIVASTGL